MQQRLNDVQLQLEEIEGRLAYLDDQSVLRHDHARAVAERGVPAGSPGGRRLVDRRRMGGRRNGIEKIVGGVLVPS